MNITFRLKFYAHITEGMNTYLKSKLGDIILKNNKTIKLLGGANIMEDKDLFGKLRQAIIEGDGEGLGWRD